MANPSSNDRRHSESEWEIPQELNDMVATEKAVFEKARRYLKPDSNVWFRSVMHLYAERKVFTVLAIHFVATIVIWVYYALIRLKGLQASLPPDTPYYMVRIVCPPIAFGSKHAILFQMTLIPLSMCRFSISALADSVFERYFPLNKVVDLHLYLGYVMVAIVWVATIVFLFFGSFLCAKGQQNFCDLLYSEIMMTGYVITLLVSCVGLTSYFRGSLSYEVFYYVHHVVFILYALTVAHTFDALQRSGERERFQTYYWFVGSVLFYCCDRAALRYSHKYTTNLVSSMVIDGSQGSKTVIIQLGRPVLFDFKPGQYAFVRMPEIDNTWHPFSIASASTDKYLSFYIEVFSEKSWTMKLYKMMQTDHEKMQIDVEVMGPCGTSLGKTEDFTHALVIGSGTGIVPVLSFYKQHVMSLTRLDPDTYYIQKKKRHNAVMNISDALSTNQGSIAAKLCHAGLSWLVAGEVKFVRREPEKESIARKIEKYETLQGLEFDTGASEMKRRVYRATRSIYLVVFEVLLVAVGVSVMGFTVSWNLLENGPNKEMRIVLQVCTIFFQFWFVVISVFGWDSDNLLAYTDGLMDILVPFADWYFYVAYEKHSRLLAGQVVVYFLLIGYMTLRCWSRAMRLQNHAWSSRPSAENSQVLEGLHLVWTTRSASQAAEILPDINSVWDGLALQWGLERAREVCRISVYVTDKDTAATASLKNEIQDLTLYKEGCILLERPDFTAIIENHSLELICSQQNSYTLLGFCGSPSLGQMLHNDKLNNDTLLAMTGNKKHQMEFAAESYGGVKSSKAAPPRPPTQDVASSPEEDCAPLTRRSRVHFAFDPAGIEEGVEDGSQVDMASHYAGSINKESIGSINMGSVGSINNEPGPSSHAPSALSRSKTLEEMETTQLLRVRSSGEVLPVATQVVVRETLMKYKTKSQIKNEPATENQPGPMVKAATKLPLIEESANSEIEASAPLEK